MKDTNSILIGGIIVTIIIIYALFSFFTPPQYDDFMFLADYMSKNNGQSTLTLRGFLLNVQFLRDTDNSRLPNLFWPVYGIASPKWVLAVILGCSMSIVVFLGAKLMSIKYRISPGWMIFFWIMIILFLPWRGNLITGVFASNYFLSSAITLLFLYYLSKTIYLQQTNSSLIWCIILGLISGMMHEGFSVPVFGGIIIYSIIKKFKLPILWWVINTAYFFGILFLFSAKGMWLRLHYIDENVTGSWDFKIHSQVLFPFVAMIFSCIVALINKKWRVVFMQWVQSPVFTICTVAAVGAFMLALRTGVGNLRAFWAVDLFSLMSLMFILQRIIQFRRLLESKILLILCYSGILLFYIQVIYFQYQFNHQYYDIIHLMRESKTGTAFYDYKVGVPKSTLLHPVYDTWWNYWTLNQLNRLAPNGEIFSVVPSGLSDLSVPIDSLPPIPGTAHAFRYKEFALMRDCNLKTKNLMDKQFTIVANNSNFCYQNVNGEKFENMPTVLSRFISPTGEKLIYIQPLHVKVKGPYTVINISELLCK